MVELAALCIVIAVGIPLAIMALTLACQLAYGICWFAWNLTKACAIGAALVVASPVLIPYVATRWLIKRYRKVTQ